MATTKAKKSEILEELKTQFKGAKSVAFTQYSGISVKQVEELRRKLRAVDAEMIVAKKTLMNIAAKETLGLELPKDVLDGPIAAVFSKGDEVAGPQTLFAFSKDQNKIILTGGLFEGSVLNKASINQLAQLPSKPQLVSQLLSVLISPMRGMAVVSSQVLSGFARVIKAVADKKASTN